MPVRWVGNYENHPGHVGYSKCADSTPGTRLRFDRSVSGAWEFVTQIPIRSLRARSLRSLVSITTVRLPDSVIRWAPVDCLDDALVFIADGLEPFEHLLARPARLGRAAAARDALGQVERDGLPLVSIFHGDTSRRW